MNVAGRNPLGSKQMAPTTDSAGANRAYKPKNHDCRPLALIKVNLWRDFAPLTMPGDDRFAGDWCSH
jgi:hypothetical protein